MQEEKKVQGTGGQSEGPAAGGGAGTSGEGGGFKLREQRESADAESWEKAADKAVKEGNQEQDAISKKLEREMDEDE